MISLVQNDASRAPRDAARPAVLRLIAGAALLAGLAATQAHAAAVPTFGALVNLGWAGTDGGMGDFDASKSWNFSNSQSSYTVAAAANLATGSLHASTFAQRDCSPYGCPQSWGVGAEARLFDRYVFTNTGENIALIPVSLRVDGNCAGDAVKSARYRFAFSSGPIEHIDRLPYHNLSCDGSTDVVAHINLLSFLGDTSWNAFVEISTGVFFPPDRGGFGFVDFGHTLKVEIVLPEGITMRSDSGVFPYQHETAIPEPATLAALGAALVGLGTMRRRRAPSYAPPSAAN